jgi:hypothetical protein
MASQSHKICVADLSSSRHISQVGLSVNPILKRCPFRWQCLVSSPTSHLNWSLFNFNRSVVLLAEGPNISPFACLSPVVDSQCSQRWYSVRYLNPEYPKYGTALIPTPPERSISVGQDIPHNSVLRRTQKSW